MALAVKWRVPFAARTELQLASYTRHTRKSPPLPPYLRSTNTIIAQMHQEERSACTCLLFSLLHFRAAKMPPIEQPSPRQSYCVFLAQGVHLPPHVIASAKPRPANETMDVFSANKVSGFLTARISNGYVHFHGQRALTTCRTCTGIMNGID